MTNQIVGDTDPRPTKERLRLSFLTMRPARRSLLWIAAVMPVLVACAGDGGYRHHRSSKVPVGTLRVDASNNKCGVAIYNDRGYNIGGGSLHNLHNVELASFPGGELGLPASIRATWLTCHYVSDGNGYWNGGTLAGDHTAPVAGRIPAEVIDYLRTKGGSLRLKIRLVDTGVLIGWDIETRIYGRADDKGKVRGSIRYVLPGGDFCERQIYAGKVVEPGWEHPPTSINNMAGQEQRR